MRILPALAIAAAAGTAEAQSPSAPALLDLTPFRSAGAAQVRAGVVRQGESVLDVPFGYGITGVLRREVRPSISMFEAPPLPAGTPVYGVPMGGAGDAGVTWCAPRAETKKNGRVVWSTTCMPRDYMGHRWVTGYQTFAVQSLRYPAMSATLAVPPPDVEPRPVEVAGPKVLSYRFRGWGSRDATLHTYFVVSGEEDFHGIVRLKREADGSAVLATSGGRVRLSPNGSDRRSAKVEVVEPLREGESVIVGQL